jgi:YVTN family beta-propeller protein
MNTIFRFAAICGLISMSSMVSAQDKGAASLLVLSKQDHTLAVVDPATLKVTGPKVPVGNDPHEVVASADGRTAWVSNYGSGQYNTLATIDLVNAKALTPVDLGLLRGPHGLDVVGGKVWFTAEAVKAIGRYDPATGKVDWLLGTGQNRTHMIWVSADQQRIVTTNVNSGTVSLMERVPLPTPGPPLGGASGPRPPGPPPGASGDGKDWNEVVVKVGNGSEGFDLSPDEKEIWVANAEGGTISVIDYAAKKVVATLDANVGGANRLKFTRDGKRVLVSTLSGPDLVVLDAVTRKVIKRVPIGHGAAGIEMEPNGKRAFVACTPDDYVAVIDLATLNVTGKIDAGGQPDGMAWAVRR